MPKPRPPRPTRAIARQATSRVAFERDLPSPDDPLLGFEPYRHKAPRSNSITPDLQREFIAHLAATGIVTSAARRIGRSLEALYKLRNRHGAEGFAQAWERAAQLGVGRIEDSAMERAILGSERKIVRNGEVIATERSHNETLVMFFLKTRMADRYAPSANIGPGHPVYEKAFKALEAEQNAKANDPEQLRQVRASIDAKMKQWKRELVDDWNGKVRAYNAENGTGLPTLGDDDRLVFPDK